MNHSLSWTVGFCKVIWEIRFTEKNARNESHDARGGNESNRLLYTVLYFRYFLDGSERAEGALLFTEALEAH